MKNTRILSLLLVVILCLSLLPLGALAEEDAIEEPAETVEEIGEAEPAAAPEPEAEPESEPAPEPELPAVEDPAVSESEEPAEPEGSADPEEMAEPAEEEEALPEDAEEPLSLDGASTFTVGSYTYSSDGIDATIVSYNGNASSVTIPTSVTYNGSTYPVKTIGSNAFDGKSALKTLVIPASIKKINQYAFRNCVKLSSVTINGDLKDCDSLTRPFSNSGTDSKSITVTFGSGVTHIPAYLFYTTSSKVDDAYAHVTKVTIPSTVTEIGSYAFYNCYDLSDVSWGSGLKTIYSYAFANCSSLTKIVLPKTMNTIGSHAFENCVKLSSVTINGDLKDCDSLTRPFSNSGTDSKSITITFGSGVTHIPAYLFYTTSSKVDDAYAHITKVTIPSTVTEIGSYAFYNCYDLSDVSWGSGLKTIYSYAFANCSSLTKIVLPKTMNTIGSHAFENCVKLSSVTINGDLKDCDSLTRPFSNSGTDSKSITITFGSGVTHIPAYLFYTTSSKVNGEYAHITKVTIPSTVTEIGYRAFCNCYDLSAVTYGGSSADWNRVSVGSDNTYLTNAKFTFSGGTVTYTITYNANGGSGAPASHEIGRISSTVPTRTGHTFLGWATSSTATTPQYQPGDSYTKNANVTLYAVWQPITYTVTFAANGGSGAPAKQTKTYGKTLTLSSTKPTRSGYTFLGWATSSTATTPQYQPGDSYTKNANVTLYAVWKKIETGTWMQNASGWWYRYSDGTYPYSQMLTIDGVKYYFKASGYLYTGWKQVDGNWYYFTASGAATGWKKLSGTWYYFDADNVMVTGLQKIDGTYYYFKSSGAMATGWQKIEGAWYYFNSSGAMRKSSWLKSGGSWYYFGSDGKMYTGLKMIGGAKYYFKSSGAMKTGWQQIGTDWYYFNSSGAMRKASWLKSGGKWYYLKSSGMMAAGETLTIDGTKYTFDAGGVWVG